MRSRLEAIGRFLRAALARESLPEPPPRVPAPRHTSRLRLLLAPEPLPAAPPREARASRDRPSLAALLFARDVLPLDPERPRRHRNWIAFLFAPERLDAPRGPGPEVH